LGLSHSVVDGRGCAPKVNPHGRVCRSPTLRKQLCRQECGLADSTVPRTPLLPSPGGYEGRTAVWCTWRALPARADCRSQARSCTTYDCRTRCSCSGQSCWPATRVVDLQAGCINEALAVQRLDGGAVVLVYRKLVGRDVQFTSKGEHPWSYPYCPRPTQRSLPAQHQLGLQLLTGTSTPSTLLAAQLAGGASHCVAPLAWL